MTPELHNTALVKLYYGEDLDLDLFLAFSSGSLTFKAPLFCDIPSLYVLRLPGISLLFVFFSVDCYVVEQRAVKFLMRGPST